MDSIFEFPDIEDSSNITVSKEWLEEWLQLGQKQKPPALPLTINLRERAPQPFNSNAIINNPQAHSNRMKIAHQCKICNKFIKGKSYNMTHHMRTHTQEKPYKCSECIYESAQLANCKRHMLLKHPPDLNACIIEILKRINNEKFITIHPIRYPEPKLCNHCNKQFYDKYT